MDIQAFGKSSIRCCAIYIGPNCLRNHCSKFEIDRITKSNLTIRALYYIRQTIIIEKPCFQESFRNTNSISSLY